MTKTKEIIYGLLALIVLLLGVGLASHYNIKHHNSFDYVANHQDKSTKQLFKDFESGKEKKIVVVLYKTTCSICDKWQYDINASLKKTDTPKGYIDASDGLPKYFTDKIAYANYEKAKTPYVYVLKKKSFNPKFEKRVNSEKRKKEMEKATE